MDDLERLLARFDIEAGATIAAVASCPDTVLDRRPAPGLRTIREQAAHLDLIRRSTAIAVHGEDGRYEELPDWPDAPSAADAQPANAQAADAQAEQRGHAAIDHEAWLDQIRDGLRIARADFARVDPAALDQPFPTPAGNSSTARNYIEMTLREEIHHRAQIYLLAKTFGHEPPPLPGRELAELGIARPGAEPESERP